MPRTVDWSQFDDLLGKQSDADIALLAGCTRKNVGNRRSKLNIPQFRSHWSNEDQCLLNDGTLRCIKCKNVKILDEFDKEDGRRGGRQRTCKQCIAIKRRTRWLTAKQNYVDALGGKCQFCGYNRFLSSMQFHHVMEEFKEFTLSRILIHDSRKQDANSELDKCCLLCSNCHDAYHAKELQLSFVKRSSIGWTVVNPWEVGSTPNYGPTEDKGLA